MRMKVIAINGSPRKDGNTFIALTLMAEELQKEGIETEIIQVGGELIRGCIACGACAQTGDGACYLGDGDDIINPAGEKMREAEGFILGSPTYFGGIAGTMKAFLDRLFYAGYRSPDKPFRNKVATCVSVARRSGGEGVFSQLNNYLTLSEVVTPPSQYWRVVHGGGKGEILQDAEGVQIIRRNANAMAWLLKTVRDGTEPLPRVEPPERTSFIR